MSRAAKVIQNGTMTSLDYDNIHKWVRRHFGKASKCSKCDVRGRRYEWSNISGNYNKLREDWIELCASCHRRIDKNGSYNICSKGHELTEKNTYIYQNHSKGCKICKASAQKRYTEKRNARA